MRIRVSPFLTVYRPRSSRAICAVSLGVDGLGAGTVGLRSTTGAWLVVVLQALKRASAKLITSRELLFVILIFVVLLVGTGTQTVPGRSGTKWQSSSVSPVHSLL